MKFTSAFALAGLLVHAGTARHIKPPHRESLIPGIVFDRFVTVWLENTDFKDAMSDPSLTALAKQGIELDNYFALTHPSEPNYVASVGGEYFGIDNDNTNRVPANVSSIVDLLEDKGITWAEYQEDMPSTAFAGNFANPRTGNSDYVRKHNPLIMFDSVVNSPARSQFIKNFTLFNQDLAANRLPQWMFITPNMTNDGHDTDVTFAGKWMKNWLTPLLANSNFNTPKTLILLTFDENEGGEAANRIRSILIGGAVTKSLVGTIDNNFYTHYSIISAAEANWGLHTLGRYDVGANVFEFVAKQTQDTVRTVDISKVELSGSYPGIFNAKKKAPLPVPNTSLVINGRTVLPSIVATWGSASLQKCTVYKGELVPPFAGAPPVLPTGC